MFSRNKELIELYKDLELVEQLGSGIPRITEHYDKGFSFYTKLLRMVFPASEQATTQVTLQVTTQVAELLKIFDGEHTRQDLQDNHNLANREHFRKGIFNLLDEFGYPPVERDEVYTEIFDQAENFKKNRM